MKIKQIIKIIAKNINISEKKINQRSCANDFDAWDSLNHIKIILDLQKNLKKKISTSESIKLNSVKSILKFYKK